MHKSSKKTNVVHPIGEPPVDAAFDNSNTNATIVEDDLGNTIHSKSSANTGLHPANTRSRHWMWTLNNYIKKEITQIENFSISYCEKYAFQEETGKEGTPHLQGYWHFKDAKSFSMLKKLWPKMHIEKSKSTEACIEYCTKSDTRTGNTYTNIITKKPLKDRMEGKIPKKWQQEIIDMIKTEPDDRTIHWYFDTKGKTGKTSLACHLVDKYPKQILYCNGKGADIKHAVAEFVADDAKDLLLCIFYFVRSTEGFISYDAIESIKDGIFFSGKYESKMVRFNPPHIICFANFPPEETKLSADRWHITNITEPIIKLPEERQDNIEDLPDITMEELLSTL